MEQADLLQTRHPVQPQSLTADDVRRLLRASRPRWQTGIRGDHDLNPAMERPQQLRPAAVLVPLVDRGPALTVLLTQRTAHLSCHAGQICFPGGRLEPSDADEETAALRETEEEIGLTADRIEICGRLAPYVTRTGFHVTPVVALIRTPFTLRPDPYEVAEVFEVPLRVILDPYNPQTCWREDYTGVRRHFYVFSYQDRVIWGATAGMLVNLRDALAQA